MTRKCVTDEQYGQVSRRVQELLRRVDEGTLSLSGTMKGLQLLIENTHTNTFVAEVDYDFDTVEYFFPLHPDCNEYYSTVADREMMETAQTKDDFRALFPNKQSGKREITFEYVTVWSTHDYHKNINDVLRIMDERGLRPPTLTETDTFMSKIWNPSIDHLLRDRSLISLCGSQVPPPERNQHLCGHCHQRTASIECRYEKKPLRLRTYITLLSHSQSADSHIFLAVRKDS